MKIHVADVLVVGGGLAGCWAALRAADLGVKVILVDKGYAGKTCMSRFASGDIKCFMPGDNLGEWMREIIVQSGHLCDQKWVRIVLEETYPRVKDMEEFGVRFEKRNGEFVRKHGRSLVTKQVVFNAKQMMEVMRKEVERRGVEIYDKIFISDLLTEGNRVIGAIGFHRWTGEFHVFQAKSTVLASGGCSFKHAYYASQIATGEGLAMAFNAGAELINMEFMNWNSCSKYYDTTGMSRFVAFGGKFINSKGEAFMENYDPTMKDRAPTSTLAIAMASEVRKGNGPIYFDLSSITDEDYELSKKLIPWLFKLLERAKINIKQKLEWTIALRGTSGSSAGIRINYQCKSSLNGLYAAGDVAAMMTHGAGSGFGGINLAFCCVSGYRAGENAAVHATKTQHIPIKEEMLSNVIHNTCRFMRRGEYSPDDIIAMLHKIIIPYDVLIIRHGKRLEKALHEIMKLRELAASQMYASDVHELAKCIEADAMITIAELVLRSALLRTESRGGHYREDFPMRDDENWLKWIVVKRANKAIEFSVVPISS